MKANKQFCMWVICFLSITGCREPFFPETGPYENLLVIDGLLTDQEGPHTVRLSRSFAFDERIPDPETGAVVAVIDEDQQPAVFQEVQPGIYQSDSAFRGSTGRHYMLVVTTLEGERYESDWVLLRSAPPIDTLTCRWEEKPTADPSITRSGMQFRITTRDPLDATRYYRWEWTETWEVITPIKSSRYLDEERCWKTTRSTEIAIGTSEHLVRDVIEDHPLYFVSSETNRLRILYSTEVSQFALSREAFSFWKNLEEISQNPGTLFDPIPSAVYGNIYPANEMSRPALGIFQASGVEKKRIFIDREELPLSTWIPSGYESCEFYEISDSAEIVYYTERSFPFVDSTTDGNSLILIFSNSEACFRCTFAGENTVPDFWPEEEE